MFDVITVGSSTIDVFAKVDSELIKIKSANHEEEMIAYPCGSKLLIKNLDFLTGGGGTNTAVALSRLGLNVAYLGRIGRGSNSGLIKKMLKKEKVKFIGTSSKKFHTGYSVILDSIEGDRTILAFKGANNELSFSSIDKEKLKTKWFYFSSMMGKSFKTLEKLAEYAKKNKINIAFNPSNYLAEMGQDFLKNLLNKTDVLILNKEESELLVGKGTLNELISRLLLLGPKQVIITNGKKGAATFDEKRKFFRIIPDQIKPVETTGAGDAFASTYLAGIILGKNIKESMKMAICNAESVIMIPGAKNGLMSLPDLEKKVIERNPKITTK